MVQLYRLIYDVSTEKKGKTIHLLKASSKPVASAKKRKKIPIQGTYEEFRDSKIKDLGNSAKKASSNLPLPPASSNLPGSPAPSNLPLPPARKQGQSTGGSSIVQLMAPAPGQKDAKMSGK